MVQRRDSSATIELGDDDATVTVWTPKLDAARIDGSGDLGLGDVVAQSAAISISGSGDADVHAVRSLDATVHGSGDVPYSGDRR